MARTITDEEIKLSIIINGNPAQKQLSDLTRANIELKKVLSGLNAEESNRRKELDKLTKEYGVNSKVIQDNELMVKKLTSQYNDEKNKLKSLEDQYGKNSNEYKKHNSLVNSLLNSSIKYENSIEKLKDANSKLNPQIDKNSKEYKQLKDRIKSLNNEIDNNVAKMNKLQSEIGLTSLSIAQLQQKATVLRGTLRNLAPDTADFKKYDAELRQVNARLGELTGKAQASKFSLSSIADGFNKYQALAFSLVATFTGVVLSIQKIIDINGKLSDAQADVMKTTGMTKDEVDELTKSFGALETRTSRIDLLKIAEQGGRIGIAKADIQDFVKNMNMANVALGDSFTGGVEEVANKLGKLKFLFQETKDMSVDKSYNAIGSAINDLGANGVASEANITEFATRLGSLPDVLKPTIKEALALGAAFEESGIEAEVSSRAYNIFMKQASTESAKFAQVMGISKKAVEDMINTNPLDFMMQFAEGMRGMDATETAKTLDFLGVNADGANKVIGAMGNNMDRFRELIDLSNNSFESGTSLINEYNVKNNNLAATLEKIKKTVTGWFSSETFIKWLTTSVSWVARLIGASEEMDARTQNLQTRFINFVKILAIVITAYLSYNSALKLIAIWTNTVTKATEIYNATQNRGTIVTTLFKSAILLLQAVFFVITGQMSRATNAMRLFNLTVSSNPLGLLLTALVTIGGALWLFKKNSDEATASIKKLNSESDIAAEVNRRFTEDFGKASMQLKSKIEPLIDVLNNQNVSLETRKLAYEKLISIAPQFKDTVDKEFMATSKLNDVYAEILLKMGEKMRFQAMQSVLQSKYNEEAKAMDKLIKAEDDLINAQKEKDDWDRRKAFKNAVNIDLAMKVKDATEAVALAQKNLTTAETNTSIVSQFRQKQINKLTDEQKKYNKESKEWLEIQNKINSLLGISSVVDKPTPANSKFNVPGDSESEKNKKNPNSSQEEINRLRVDSDSRYNDILLKNRRQLEDDKIAAMQEGYQKELAIENLRYQREIEDLERQKVHTEEMAKMDEDISKAKQAGDMTKYNALINIKNEWKKRNELIDTQINQIQEGKLRIHNQKLGIIYENAEKARIENFQKQFERQKLLRETDYNNQLAALGDNEIAKEKLKKEYDKKELEETEKHLQQLIKRLKASLALGNIFNLLTPAQKDKIQKDLEFALNALSQVQKGKKGEGKFSEAARSVFGQTDILGFTPNQWESTFQNLDTLKGQLEAVNMVVSGLQNMWSTYANFQTASENRNLKNFEVNSDKKKARLKRQLDAGYINQSTYDRQIKRIDDEYEKRKLEIEYKQAKREKAQALVSAIINTAKSVTAVLYNPFLAAIAAAMGALQIATIAKQPLPARGYEEGLYPVKREQDGKIFQSRFGGKTKSGLVTKPTYFLTGENGPEMIIDSRAYSQISPETKNALLRELRGIKGFENGMYNQSAQRFEVPASSSPSSGSANDDALKMNAMVMAEVLEVLKDLRDKGVEGRFYKGDLQSAKNIKDSISDYETLRNKNKL